MYSDGGDYSLVLPLVLILSEIIDSLLMRVAGVLSVGMLDRSFV